MKQLIFLTLLFPALMATAQARHDTSFHSYYPHYPPEDSTESTKNKNYQYSYVEFSQNPHAMTVHTKFNIQNYDTLHTIVEAIDGVEDIDTWGVHKYDFLVITGDMFDPYKVAASIQQKIEYIVAPRIDSMLYYRQMVVHYVESANFYRKQFHDCNCNEHKVKQYMKLFNFNIDQSRKHLYYKGKNVLSEFPDHPLTDKEKNILGL